MRGTLHRIGSGVRFTRFIPARAGNTGAPASARPTPPVHPRTCGEHVFQLGEAGFANGSSPHVRGTRYGDSRRALRRRFIPARAGNTTARRPARRATTVHPRTCGEHDQSVDAAGSYAGSSPHVRGTPHQHGRQRPPLRFIPARAGNTGFGQRDFGSSPHVRGTRAQSHPAADAPRFIPARAGNTHRSSASSAARSVHPRTCGEHLSGNAVYKAVVGSSPHVRGTQQRLHVLGVRRRFIPARAGNTRERTIPRRRWPVHPRTCGEHLHREAEIAERPGSSPHVRGTPAPRRSPRPRLRFIPARAGNTAPASRRWPCFPVHPRTCGEHYSSMIALAHSIGSSPHVRGTRRGRGPEVRPHRFIPARAGNTTPSASTARSAPVHPRTCGEHRCSGLLRMCRIGSSPHVRGTLDRRVARLLPDRFIPARAGNTLRPPSPNCRRSVHPRTCGEHLSFLSRSRRSAVHPRTCGEHAYSPSMAGPYTGSSPHVRGTPALPGQQFRRLRFIPARAGNTRLARRTRMVVTVHPRTCGEHSG